MSDLGVLRLQLTHGGCDGFVTEHRFHEKRMWRFDLAWVDEKVAVEYEGGLYQRGWHQSIQRYAGDCQKYNAAVRLGWRVLRYTAADSIGDIVEQVREVLGREG